MSTETSSPTLLDPIGTAALFDTIFPPKGGGKPWDRRAVYRVLQAAPPGVLVRLPGRLYVNRDRLLEWLLAGGTAAPTPDGGAA